MCLQRMRSQNQNNDLNGTYLKQEFQFGSISSRSEYRENIRKDLPPLTAPFEPQTNIRIRQNQMKNKENRYQFY